MPFTVYILRTSRNTLYTGQTNNLGRRLQEHTSSKTRGAKYTRSFKPVELVHTEVFDTKKEALQREYQIKQMTKSQKEALVKL